jgi:hypothetical protein
MDWSDRIGRRVRLRDLHIVLAVAEAGSGAWLRKKVRHSWLGGPRRLTMYLATLDCAISNPSLSSLPGSTGASIRHSAGIC